MPNTFEIFLCYTELILASHVYLSSPVNVRATCYEMPDKNVKIVVTYANMCAVSIVARDEWDNRPKDTGDSLEGSKWALRCCGWTV